MALGGALADFQGCGSLLDGESCEVTKFHKASLLGIARGEEVERFVDGEKFILRFGSGDLDLIHIDPRHRPAAAGGVLAAGSLDEDAPHRFGGGTEEMSAIFKNLIAEAQPRLVDERGRLERVAISLASHFSRSELAELGVNQRDQIAGGVIFTAADGVQQERHIIRGTVR